MLLLNLRTVNVGSESYYSVTLSLALKLPTPLLVSRSVSALLSLFSINIAF